MAVALALAPLIAAPAQRRRQLLLQHRLDKVADAPPNARLDRVKPGFTAKQDLPVRRPRAICLHDVVSSRRANAGLWLPILNRRLRHPNSNHIPDGTGADIGMAVTLT